MLSFLDPVEFHGVYVYYVSVYLNIIGVLLAIAWCSSIHWSDGENKVEYEKRKASTIGTLKFAPRTSSAGTVAAGMRSVEDVGLNFVSPENE